jgi:hypothetical protein
MRLGPRGVERFEDTIPTMWVTAPTDEKLNTGFLINGVFTPDAGAYRRIRNRMNRSLSNWER